MLNDKEMQSKIAEIVTSKINAIIADQCKSYGIIGTDTQLHFTENYIFAVSHTKVETSKSMHRYNIFCFSPMAMSLYYSDSNVIDGDKFYTIERAIQQTKNFFAHHSAQLNEVSL